MTTTVYNKGHLSRQENMIRVNKELSAYVTRLYHEETDSELGSLKFSPKEKVIDQGKRIFSVFIIKSGIAKCLLSEDNGKDFIQEFFAEGEIFGEIEVIDKNVSFCSIEAITDLEVYQIKDQHFHNLLATDKKFNHLIIRALANKVRYKAIRHAYNQSHAIEDNLLRLMKEFPSLFRDIAKQDIANYLGITLRSLNRTINDLERKK